MEAGFFPNKATVIINRADDVGDQYGFELTSESGQSLSE